MGCYTLPSVAIGIVGVGTGSFDLSPILIHQCKDGPQKSAISVTFLLTHAVVSFFKRREGHSTIAYIELDYTCTQCVRGRGQYVCMKNSDSE